MQTNKFFINITLLNGTPEGALKITNKAHDGIVYRIKRDDIDNYANVAELKQCGVYLLFGKEKKKKVVYIGQANTRKNGNGVLGRVIEHRKNKERYWDEAFVVISSKNAIGATELNYLENQLCNRIVKACEYELINSVDPNSGNYSDEVEITMDSLIAYFETVLNVLGYYVFGRKKNNRILDSSEDKYKDCLRLYINKSAEIPGRNCQVVCVVNGGDYIILKGSKVATVAVDSCHISSKRIRAKYKNLITSNGEVLDDLSFNSPSALAQFATLSSVNGKLELKNSEGKSLKTIIEERDYMK